MKGTPSPDNISTRLQRIARLARETRKTALTTLSHHIDVEFLEAAFRKTRKDGAVGVDGVTARMYEANLKANLEDLLNRFKSGTYQAPHVKRVHIPKGDGKTRPIGIPAFEDKVLQRAVAMVVGAVYEEDFLPCSFGCRPGRSQHDALDALRGAMTSTGGGTVIDLDVSKFFDTLQHAVLREFLDQRIKDGVIRRAIDKWLKAGVLEEGQVFYPTEGTPQGGVVSPLLANIYLHEVLDKWFENDVKPRLRGEATLVRFVDDAVIVLTDPHDAARVMEVLPHRFARYGLKVHPEKTKKVSFKHPWSSGGDSPGTFTFLGFCVHWAKTRKGGWAIKTKTAKDRLKRALLGIAEWCRENRHLPVPEQRKTLGRKLVGHCNYYGRAGNARALQTFAHRLTRIWFKWLSRRSQRRRLTWAKFLATLKLNPLPPARGFGMARIPAATP